VNVVSKLHARGTNAAMFDGLDRYDSWAAYGTSKLALVHHAAELHRRHGEVGLRAMSLHPGSVFTHIADRGLESAPVLGRLRALAAPLERRVLLTPEQGAQTTLHCATDPGVRHGYFTRCAPAEPSTEALDVVASQRLWEETERWIGDGR
jgi:NAD(P)-dependent dehydrogenase (short-subunit alcohol dehydrogenase family)